MIFTEVGSRHAFVEVFRDQSTRDPVEMVNTRISIVHYDDSLSPVEIVDVPDTSMTPLGDGKYLHFQDIDSTIFSPGEIYYARVRATHPVDLVEEITEQQFKVVAARAIGRLAREYFTEGDKRVFVVDFRDGGTRLPLDMINVTIEIAYYDDALTPLEHFALTRTSMVSLGSGRYVYLLEIDDSFPTNTEFFARYRGIHPVDGTEEIVQEEFSSFDSTVVDAGLQTFPVEPF